MAYLGFYSTQIINKMGYIQKFVLSFAHEFILFRFLCLDIYDAISNLENYMAYLSDIEHALERDLNNRALVMPIIDNLKERFFIQFGRSLWRFVNIVLVVKLSAACEEPITPFEHIMEFLLYLEGLLLLHCILNTCPTRMRIIRPVASAPMML